MLQKKIHKRTTSFEKNAKKQKLKKVISQLYDLKTDQNIKINKIGKIECKVCHTQHNSESSYIIHQNSIKHQLLAEKRYVKSNLFKFLPQYKMYNVKNELFEGFLCKIKTNLNVQYKIIKSTEQNVEPVNKNYNYVILIVPGLNLLGFKVPIRNNYDIINYFDGDIYKIQILYSIDKN